MCFVLVENEDFQGFFFLKAKNINFDLQVMEFVKLFDPAGHARVTMAKSPQDYLKAGDVSCVSIGIQKTAKHQKTEGEKDVCVCVFMIVYVDVSKNRSIYPKMDGL